MKKTTNCMGVYLMVIACALMVTQVDAMVVTNSSPAHAAVDVVADTNVTVEFSEALSNETVNTSTFKVWGKQSGFVTGDFTFPSAVSGGFNPSNDFKAGESVVVMLNTGILSSAGAPLTPYQFQFVAEAGGSAFFEMDPYAFGSTSGYAVALGDLDGDGDLDAFVGLGDDGGATVFTNDGSGLFSPMAMALTNGAGTVYAIELGDLDDDGDLDAVFLDEPGLRIFKNDGSAVFSSNQFIDVDDHQDLALGDLDGDGDLDAYVLGGSDGTNWVLLNDGAGVFTGNALTQTVEETSVALGDLDGDGDLDVVGAGGPTSVLYRNQGDATFAAPEDLGINDRHIALGDLNGDGNLDLFGADRGTVYLNDGSGTFTTNGNSLSSQVSRKAALGDLDGDGDLDAVVIAGNWWVEYGPVDILLNDGSGNFTLNESSPSNAHPDLALGDLDGDGDLDALVMVDQGESLVYRNSSDFKVMDTTPDHAALDVAADTDIQVEFSAALSNETVNTSTFKVWGKQTGFYTGDYSFGSATFDPLDNFKPGENVVVMLNTGVLSAAGLSLVPHQFEFVAAAGGCADFRLQTNQNINVGDGDYNDVALGDLDGDGDLDAVAPVWDDSTGVYGRVYQNDGNGRFSANQIFGSDELAAVALGDFDNDGDLDALAVASSPADLVLLNDGTGTFSTNQMLNLSINSRAIDLGDLDGDGDLDAVMAGIGNSVRVYLNEGTGVFTTNQLLGSVINRYGVRIGDLDGDGDLDVFVTVSGGSEVYLNDGIGSFSTNQLFGSGTGRRAADLGDLDGDGDLDAFVTAVDGNPDQVYLNDGTGTFSTNQLLGADNSTQVALGDLDGDGDLDALVVTYGGYFDKVYLNDGSGFFASSQFLSTNLARDVALGDLDGDDVLDAFIVGDSVDVYLNTGCLPADGLIAWDFAGNTGNETTVVATLVHPWLEPTTITRGTGLFAGYETNSFYAYGFPGSVGNTNYYFNDDDYYQFVIDPRPGYRYSLSNVMLQMHVKLPYFPTNSLYWRLASDRDGYTADLDLWGQTLVGRTQTISLAGNPLFQDITKATTFRLYGYDVCSSGPAGLKGSGDDVLIQGTVELDPSATEGQLLAWDFDGNAGNEATVDATTVHSNLQTTMISRGSGLGPYVETNSYYGDGFPGGSADTNYYFNADDYLEFSIDPRPGYGYALTGVVCQMRVSDPYMTPPTNSWYWRLASDRDGYAADLDLWGQLLTDRKQTISLPDNPLFQEITTATTFRLYGYNVCARGAAGFKGSGDDLELSGRIWLDRHGDADGDGMENEWELDSTGTTTGAVVGANFDGDYFTDNEEWIALTDAGDSNDYFRLIDIAIGSPPAVSITSAVGRVYSLQYNNQLTTGQWINVSGQTNIYGNGGLLTLPDTITNDMRSYRVKVAKP